MSTASVREAEKSTTSLSEAEKSTTSLGEAEKSTTSGATRRVSSRAKCRGTRKRGGGEVVDDEPARGGVVDDERRDEPRVEPRDVPRHPDARRR
jgi:hypothetical protein